jgi:hypothetical protein
MLYFFNEKAIIFLMNLFMMIFDDKVVEFVFLTQSAKLF